MKASYYTLLLLLISLISISNTSKHLVSNDQDDLLVKEKKEIKETIESISTLLTQIVVSENKSLEDSVSKIECKSKSVENLSFSIGLTSGLLNIDNIMDKSTCITSVSSYLDKILLDFDVSINKLAQK